VEVRMNFEVLQRSTIKPHIVLKMNDSIRRIAKVLALILGPFVFAIVAGGVFVWMVVPQPPSDAILSQLRADGEKIARRIEAYKAENGQFPKSMVSAGITPPSNRFGGWRYGLHYDSYYLKTGIYGEHGFELTWWGNGGVWMLDV